MDGREELPGVAAGQVGAAYGSGEESVTGEEEGVGGEVEADGAFSVAGGVEDVASKASDGDELAVVKGIVGGLDVGSGDA